MVPTAAPPNPAPRRIGVFRALQLGDMLCAVPALRSLRCAFPDAHITLIGLPWARSFVERFSHYVDEFLEFPGWPSLPDREPDLGAIPSFLTAARAHDFDLVVQMHGDGRVTNTIVSLLGARIVAGACAGDAWRPQDGRFVDGGDGLSERERALQAMLAIGVPPVSRDLEFPVFDHDREELYALPAYLRLRGKDVVVVHPGARADQRRWPAVYFAAVADQLAAEGHAVAITGSHDERELATEVAASMQRRPAVLAGETSLGSLAALIESSRLVVCNDTGVSHLADALRVPSVVMFTGSDPARWAPHDAAMHRTVQHPETLDPQRVLAHAHDLLSRRAAHAV